VLAGDSECRVWDEVNNNCSSLPSEHAERTSNHDSTGGRNQ
jgi:hypothetical protein